MTNLNSDVIPERTWIDRRIERAIDRMFSASQDCWAYRWADLAYRLMEAKRNTPSRDRESGEGAAASGSQSVADLERQSTTEVVAMEGAV